MKVRFPDRLRSRRTKPATRPARATAPSFMTSRRREFQLMKEVAGLRRDRGLPGTAENMTLEALRLLE